MYNLPFSINFRQSQFFVCFTGETIFWVGKLTLWLSTYKLNKLNRAINRAIAI